MAALPGINGNPTGRMMAYCRLSANYRDHDDPTTRPPMQPWIRRDIEALERGACFHPKKLRKVRWYSDLYWATPPWLNSDMTTQMREIYNSCPKHCQVDHIVPLHNPLVCGLHVPWNLQQLPIAENQFKSNHDWPENPHGTDQLFAPADPHQLSLV